jgi:hypothetical protein
MVGHPDLAHCEKGQAERAIGRPGRRQRGSDTVSTCCGSIKLQQFHRQQSEHDGHMAMTTSLNASIRVVPRVASKATVQVRLSAWDADRSRAPLVLLTRLHLLDLPRSCPLRGRPASGLAGSALLTNWIHGQRKL